MWRAVAGAASRGQGAHQSRSGTLASAAAHVVSSLAGPTADPARRSPARGGHAHHTVQLGDTRPLAQGGDPGLVACKAYVYTA